MLLCTEIETDAPPRNSENARAFFYWLPRGESFFLFFFYRRHPSFFYLFIFFFISPPPLPAFIFKKTPYTPPGDWRVTRDYFFCRPRIPPVPRLSFFRKKCHFHFLSLDSAGFGFRRPRHGGNNYLPVSRGSTQPPTLKYVIFPEHRFQ